MQRRHRDLISRAGRLFSSIMLITAVVAGVSTDAFAKKKKAGNETAQSSGAAVIDLNTADQKALESLPGIGPASAKAIIAGRPYKSVDDLKRVKGMSDSKLKAIRDKVTVGGAAAPVAATGAPAAPVAERKAAPAQQEAAGKESKAKPKLAPGQRVNINTASREELEALPGIGPAKAQAIIDGRPYASPEDIMKVKGIKQGIFNKIKDNITIR